MSIVLSFSLNSTSISQQQHTHFNPSSSSSSSSSSSFFLKTQIPKRPISFIPLAKNNNDELKPEKEKENEKEKEKEKERSIFGNIRWGDLLLDPDPNNILAVGLTGLLTWASVQVLWQLLFISLAILVAALKYSFIAAVLLFILITLL